MHTQGRWLGLAAGLLLLAGGASGVAAEDGAEVYKAKCAKCHGETGKGDTPTGKSMKTPSLVGDEKVLQGSEAQLVQAIRENKKHKEPVKKAAEAELRAVIPYIKKLAQGQ